MVTIEFSGKYGSGEVTVKGSQKESVIDSLRAVGYNILKIEE